MKKLRIFSLLLTICMVLSFLPAIAVEVGEGMEDSFVAEEFPAEKSDDDRSIGTDEGEIIPFSEEEAEPEAVTVTVNIKYVEFVKYDSGGSHYNKSTVLDTETQTFNCTPNEANELVLDLPADGHVVEVQFNAGNTDSSIIYSMDGTITLCTTPTKDAVITVFAGKQWTSRMYVYNLVLVNGAYVYQLPNSAVAATMLLPKGQDAANSFAATGAREPAYEGGNIRPAISGDYADYEYSGRYYATYYDNNAKKSVVVADSANGVDNFADYGLQIDPATGELTSLDGQTSPALTGNEYFSLFYYHNLPGEMEQGNVYTYSFFEDPEGAYSYRGKNYRNDAAYSTQVKQDLGKTVSYDTPDVDGYVYTGSTLYQFNAAGKWVPLADDAFDFNITGKTVSVTTQRGYLAFYNYYDAASTITVNRVYDSAYSAQPVFDSQPDFTDTADVKVALGKSYTADAASGHEGYTLVTAKTEVVGSEAQTDENGAVTVTASTEADGKVTITYYYYRELQDTGTPDVPSYKVTVEYVNLAGENLASAYSTRLSSGSQYNVSAQAAKTIEGYTIDHVEGETSGTVRGPVTITVYYKAATTTEIPEEKPPLTDLPETEIPEEKPPLTDLPETEIPEGETPLTDLPEDDVVILDPETPLGALPQTGSVGMAFPAAIGAAALTLALAMAGTAAILKKKED